MTQEDTPAEVLSYLFGYPEETVAVEGRHLHDYLLCEAGLGFSVGGW